MVFPFPTTSAYLGVTSAEILTHVSYAGYNPTIPATVESGDLLVVGHYAQDDTPNIPSGWTTIASAGNANGIFSSSGAMLAYKIASASDASTTLTGLSYNANRSGGVLYVFRANERINSVTVSTSDRLQYAGTGSSSGTYYCSSSTKPTIALACLGQSSTDMIATTPVLDAVSNYGEFRNASGGSDPIGGSENYFGGYTDSGDESGATVYALCQTPSAAVDIYSYMPSGTIRAHVAAYIEVS